MQPPGLHPRRSGQWQEITDDGSRNDRKQVEYRVDDHLALSRREPPPPRSSYPLADISDQYHWAKSRSNHESELSALSICSAMLSASVAVSALRAASSATSSITWRPVCSANFG